MCMQTHTCTHTHKYTYPDPISHSDNIINIWGQNIQHVDDREKIAKHSES